MVPPEPPELVLPEPQEMMEPQALPDLPVQQVLVEVPQAPQE